MAQAQDSGPSTKAVHVGHEPDPNTGAVGLPIWQVSTFEGPRRRLGDGWTDGPWMYTRYGNPTVAAVERKMASLEDAQASRAFSSGMAAIAAAVLSSVPHSRSLVAMRDVYGGTAGLFGRLAEHHGMKVIWVDQPSAEAVGAAVDSSTGAVYLETPTNPLNRIIDYAAVVRRLEDAYGESRPRVLLDATFGSPINFRPHLAGVDLVIHSATKYLNGHSDVIGGLVSGSNEAVAALTPYMRSFGGCMDPHQAFLLGRGMRTLALRMRAHNENAQELSKRLAADSRVSRVWHPSQPDHPEHELAKRLMADFGGIVTVALVDDTVDAASRFIHALRLVKVAPSLGGVETLASLPVETSHAGLDENARQAQGITPGMIRVAVGIEDVEDIWRDLECALAAV